MNLILHLRSSNCLAQSPCQGRVSLTHSGKAKPVKINCCAGLHSSGRRQPCEWEWMKTDRLWSPLLLSEADQSLGVPAHSLTLCSLLSHCERPFPAASLESSGIPKCSEPSGFIVKPPPFAPGTYTYYRAFPRLGWAFLNVTLNIKEKPGLVSHTSNSSTWEVKVEELGFHGQPGLHKTLERS